MKKKICISSIILILIFAVIFAVYKRVNVNEFEEDTPKTIDSIQLEVGEGVKLNSILSSNLYSSKSIQEPLVSGDSIKKNTNVWINVVIPNSINDGVISEIRYQWKDMTTSDVIFSEAKYIKAENEDISEKNYITESNVDGKATYWISIKAPDVKSNNVVLNVNGYYIDYSNTIKEYYEIVKGQTYNIH